jgi:hypothetical protein
MTLDEARTFIANGCDHWPRLVDAANIICDSPESSFDDLLACLKHRGLPQEFAAMKLYLRTKRPRASEDLSTFVMDPQDWSEYLEKMKFK